MKSVFKTQCSVAVLLMALSQSGVAQQTTSSVRGIVTDNSDKPLSGSEITLINTETGISRTVYTDAKGEFNIRNLPAGSGYDVLVKQPSYTSERTNALSLNLGQTAELAFSLDAASARIICGIYD